MNGYFNDESALPNQIVFAGTTMLQRVNVPLCEFLLSVFSNMSSTATTPPAQRARLMKYWGLYFDAGSTPRSDKMTTTKLDTAAGLTNEVRHLHCQLNAIHRVKGDRTGLRSLLSALCLWKIFAFPLNRVNADVPIPDFLDASLLQKVSLWIGLCRLRIFAISARLLVPVAATLTAFFQR